MLMRDASHADVAAAHGLLSLITDGGFDRGKDLAAEFDALRAELGS